MATNTKFLTLEGLGYFKEKEDTLIASKATAAQTAAIDASTLTVDTTATSEGAAKSYTLKQGGNKVAVIDIPKDMVVSDGKVVVDPEGEAKGTYLELTIANNDGTKVYIPVGNLIDIYTAEQKATQIQLAISAGNVISGTIVAGSVGTTELADKAVTAAKIADNTITKGQLVGSIGVSLGKADTAVQAVAEGATNGTVSVDGTDVAVHGLGGAAYVGTDAFDAAGSADAVDAKVTAKVTALETGAVATNTSDISTLKTKISTLEAAEPTAITNGEIDALFAQA